MFSEEVVAGAQIHGAPHARAFRQRRLLPRSDSGLANPGGALVICALHLLKFCLNPDTTLFFSYVVFSAEKFFFFA